MKPTLEFAHHLPWLCVVAILIIRGRRPSGLGPGEEGVGAMYAINRKTNAVYNRGTDMKEDPLESGSSFVIVFHRDNDIAHFTPLIDILVACGG